MSMHFVKVGETGKKIKVHFKGRENGIADATAVALRYKVGATLYSRPMTIVDSERAEYFWTNADFAVLNGPMEVDLDYKITTPAGDIFWPDPAFDKLHVESPQT